MILRIPKVDLVVGEKGFIFCDLLFYLVIIVCSDNLPFKFKINYTDRQTASFKIGI